MTLYRQLLITMLLLFAMLFVTAYWVQFSSTRTYLAEQQQTTVINTATSLGLALTPYLENGDALGAESVINAVFDGGFYRSIRLDLLVSERQILKEHTALPRRVPSWFVNLGLFEGARHEAVLTSGWLQLGHLYVEGHPGQAYYELWRGMSRLATWFLICFLVVWGFLVLALRYLLKPLHDIEVQAKEIELHHFGKYISLPATRELREVVSAINNMSGKLEEQFKEQAEEVERLRHRAFLDETSGLGNRSYFVSQSQSWINDNRSGAALLISVDILERIYQKDGFTARDQIVISIAEILRHIIQPLGEHTLARISAYEYALLVPISEPDFLLQFGDKINSSIADVIGGWEEDKYLSFVGITVIQSGDDIAKLLARVDNAIGQARREHTKTVVLDRGQSEDSMGRLAWKSLVENALLEDGFEYSAQAVQDFSGVHYHDELFVLIRKGDKVYHAGQFLPAVEQFKLGESLDRHIIKKALDFLSARPELKLAVNLTQQSCHQQSFWIFLKELVERYPEPARRLVLEIPEGSFSFDKEELIFALGKLKLAWGIDHFGRHFDLLNRLGELRPHYVKLDHGYTSQITSPGFDDAFLTAICRFARHMGAVTIATRVQSQTQVGMLRKLHIDAYQGFISPPRHLE
ncbi:LapD/MoxY N-terminal periplasmic domain-containing protein [Zobellella sp. An-6]|uniref:LapD/MoxY N-terminal periplasmic domain-containing protein n=1 Tax=Zobellella sp. An-6 TaxID=3400218 RepID=UPI0040419BB7